MPAPATTFPETDPAIGRKEKEKQFFHDFSKLLSVTGQKKVKF
jgi:hypothetical protein